MSSDPRQQRGPHQMTATKEPSTVCTMSDFFKDYAQTVITLTGTLIVLVLITLTLMFSIPYYLNWTAGKSIQRNELLGMAQLARLAQESQIVVERAQSEVVAMGIIATGQRSAATSKAEAIRIIGDAARRYPEYAEDEYLMSLSNAIKEGNNISVNVDK